MVTHELTVFPDGRVDGSVSARNGDYKSHTLHFVLAEGLTGASAKLMVWAPGAEKAVVYDTAKGNGSCTGQDVTVTPVLWSGPGRTRLQLELHNSAGDVVWQSRRFVAVVEDGIPDDAVEPDDGGGGTDTSDATVAASDVEYGKIFYGANGRGVGSDLLTLGLSVADKTETLKNTLQFPNWASVPCREVKDVAASATLYFLYFGYEPGVASSTSLIFGGKTCLLLQMMWRRGLTMYLDDEELGCVTENNWCAIDAARIVYADENHVLKCVLPGNGGTRIYNIIPYDVTLANA